MEKPCHIYLSVAPWQSMSALQVKGIGPKRIFLQVDHKGIRPALPPPRNLRLTAAGNEVIAEVNIYGLGVVVVSYNWYLDGHIAAETPGPMHRFTDLEYNVPYNIQASVTIRTGNLESDITDVKQIILREPE